VFRDPPEGVRQEVVDIGSAVSIHHRFSGIESVQVAVPGYLVQGQIFIRQVEVCQFGFRSGAVGIEGSVQQRDPQLAKHGFRSQIAIVVHLIAEHDGAAEIVADVEAVAAQFHTQVGVVVCEPGCEVVQPGLLRRVGDIAIHKGGKRFRGISVSGEGSVGPDGFGCNVFIDIGFEGDALPDEAIRAVLFPALVVTGHEVELAAKIHAANPGGVFTLGDSIKGKFRRGENHATVPIGVLQEGITTLGGTEGRDDGVSQPLETGKGVTDPLGGLEGRVVIQKVGIAQVVVVKLGRHLGIKHRGYADAREGEGARSIQSAG